MPAKPRKKRLDTVLLERGLADSLPKAAAMILAGEVLVDGARVAKSGTAIADSASIEVRGRSAKYVSRGGLKLEGALTDCGIGPRGRVCLDIGASTGGFTDCLLQHGATRVYALDVNVDQLAWKLRGSPSVVRIERNARELRRRDIPEAPQLITIDVSFISAAKLVATAAAVACRGADLLILVKPQFELPRSDISAGGLVTSPALHEKAVSAVRTAALAAGLEVLGIHPSRITGAEGNLEFFLHARKKAS